MSSTGRLKASDLPLAVPVVTIVWPRVAASSASAWCDQSASIPAALERLAQRGVERPSGSGVATPGRGALAGGRHELLLAPASRAPRPRECRCDTGATGLP